MTPRSTRTTRRLLGAVAALAIVAAACGGDDDDAGDTGTADTADAASSEGTSAESSAAETSAAETSAAETSAAETSAAEEASGGTAGGDCAETDSVRLQLQWVTQAQFAGYYAAADQGYYDAYCLDVDILEGGVDIQPHVQLANGDADFAISWVSKALAGREAGAEIVDIAQIFQRSGTLQVSFVDAGITSPADFAGKKIGNWGFGNEYEVFAALGQAGIDPATPASDGGVDLVAQNFDMSALLNGDIDAAEAMTYNEYAQVLEAVNPETGELYTPDDFNVVNYTDEGVGMLQDAIWADGTRLGDDDYRDVATRFVAASIEGWVYCRDNVEACQQIVLDNGPALGASHQLWQMNEVNKLIWPSPDGVGYIDPAEWDKTVDISLNTPNLEDSTVLTEPPSDDASTNDIVEAAWALLADKGLDLDGADYTPIEVTLTEGGN